MVRLLGVLTVLGAVLPVLDASPAHAYQSSCTNGRWFWWNKLVAEDGTTSRFFTRLPEYDFAGQFYPIDGGNNYFAQGDGAQAWNEYRSPCTYRPAEAPLQGRHFGQVELLPQGVRNPMNMADNYNMFGYMNFVSPPGDSNSVCRGEMIANANTLWGLTCVHAVKSQTSSNYFTRDWGIAINVSGNFKITTSYGKAGHYLLQSMAAHEFSHVLGLYHGPAEQDPNCFGGTWHTLDTNTAMTFYGCQTPSAAHWPYDLGYGDILGAHAQS